MRTRWMTLALLCVCAILGACNAAPSPTLTPFPAGLTAAPTAQPTATASPTAAPSVSPSTAAKPYQDVFGGVGNYSALDASPLVAGRSYLVDWSYGGPSGACALVAGFQGTGQSVAVQFVNEAEQNETRNGHATIKWATENGTDPRLVVISQCQWVITIKQTAG